MKQTTAILVLALCCHAAISAQRVPDFSGTWVLDDFESVTTGGPVRVGDPGSAKPTLQEPRKIKDVRPIHPHDSDWRPQMVAGTVVIEATIDKAGNVADMAVIMSIPALNRAALDAVRQWKFTPALLDNVPVPVVMRVKVTFSAGSVQPFRATPTNARSGSLTPTRVTVIQNAVSLTLTRDAPDGPQVMVYRLDGTESKNNIPVHDGEAVKAEAISLSHWQGAKLVTIITSPTQQQRTETRYLDGATMVVETVTPSLQGADPIVSRQIYNKIR